MELVCFLSALLALQVQMKVLVLLVLVPAAAEPEPEQRGPGSGSELGPSWLIPDQLLLSDRAALISRSLRRVSG